MRTRKMSEILLYGETSELVIPATKTKKKNCKEQGKPKRHLEEILLFVKASRELLQRMDNLYLKTDKKKELSL